MKKAVLLALMMLTVWSVNAEPEGLTTLRNTYMEQLAKIADEEMGGVATLQEQYIAALTALELNLQKSGQLEPLIQARKEKARFAEARTVKSDDISVSVREIAALQNEYIAKNEALPLGPAQRRMTLAGFYERSLQKLEADLTRQNDITGAMGVKAERDGLSKREEVVAARAIVEAATPDTPVVVEQPVRVEESKVSQPETAKLVSKAKIESEIRKRFSAFIDAVEDQDWRDALEFVDPEYVRKTGEQVSLSVLKMKFSVARIVGDDPTAKFRIDDIEVGEDGTHVVVRPEIWARNKARSIDNMNWVAVDGEWYLRFGARAEAMAEAPGAQRPPKPFRRRR